MSLAQAGFAEPLVPVWLQRCQVTTRGCWCKLVRKEGLSESEHLFEHHLPEELLAKFPLCCLPETSFY